MSAADAREELEAAVHRELAAAYKRGRTALMETITGPFASERVLGLADAYASAVADERIAGRVHDRTVGRERLAGLDAAVRGVTR